VTTASHHDVIIIGGGIVGLAVALEIVKRFPRLKLLLLEKEARVGQHQSGHNSGVIHSGVYYKPGSLKARLCVEGARAMLEFCRTHGIPHQICGKVIVATHKEELPRLQELQRRGTANGLTGLREIGPEELHEIEPHASGIRALAVPSTGITDYLAVCEKYADLIRQQGGNILTSTQVTGLHHLNSEVVVESDHQSFTTKFLINCAGLFSDRVARMDGGDPDVIILPFRGEYYDLVPERAGLVRGLIYPVPDPQFRSAVSFSGRAFHAPHQRHGGCRPQCGSCVSARGVRTDQLQPVRSFLCADVPRILEDGRQTLAQWIGRISPVFF
jgi:L-2-hydroxyglutarate oxidase LhgO